MELAERSSALEKIHSDDVNTIIEGIREITLIGHEEDVVLLEDLKGNDNFIVQVEAEKAVVRLKEIVLEKKRVAEEEQKKKDQEFERKNVIEKLLSSDDREKIRLEEIRKLEEIKRRKEAEKLKIQEQKKDYEKRKLDSEKKKLEERKQNAAEEFRDNIRKEEMEKLGLVKYKDEYITQLEYDSIRARELEKNRKRSEAVSRKISRLYEENRSKIAHNLSTASLMVKLVYLTFVALLVSPAVIFSLPGETDLTSGLVPFMIFITTISLGVFLIALIVLYNQIHQICLNRIIHVSDVEKVIDNVLPESWIYHFFENLVIKKNPELKKRLEDGETYTV